MPLDRAAGKIARPEIGLHRLADFFPAGGAHFGVDAAVGDDLDVAVGQQQIDQHAVVVGGVPDPQLRENVERALARRLVAEQRRAVERASTTKRTWPEWVASPALMARSITAITSGGKMRRTRQRCAMRCLPMRLMPMSTSLLQLPDAPPPPKLPPPPLNPLSLELLPELRDRPTAAGPGAASAAPPPIGKISPNSAKMKAAMPTMTDAAIDPTKSQATKPIKPPVAAEPTSRPSVLRRMPPMMTAPMMTKGLNGSMIAGKARAAPVLRFRRRQLLAVDHPDHPVDARRNAAGKIAGLEFRRDVFVDDAPVVASVSAPSRP